MMINIEISSDEIGEGKTSLAGIVLAILKKLGYSVSIDNTNKGSFCGFSEAKHIESISNSNIGDYTNPKSGVNLKVINKSD